MITICSQRTACGRDAQIHFFLFKTAIILTLGHKRYVISDTLSPAPLRMAVSILSSILNQSSEKCLQAHIAAAQTAIPQALMVYTPVVVVCPKIFAAVAFRMTGDIS